VYDVTLAHRCGGGDGLDCWVATGAGAGDCEVTVGSALICVGCGRDRLEALTRLETPRWGEPHAVTVAEADTINAMLCDHRAGPLDREWRRLGARGVIK